MEEERRKKQELVCFKSLMIGATVPIALASLVTISVPLLLSAVVLWFFAAIDEFESRKVERH